MYNNINIYFISIIFLLNISYTNIYNNNTNKNISSLYIYLSVCLFIDLYKV